MSSNLKNVDESDMVNSRIEALAKKAFRAAYKEALASEGGVTAVADGVLYQVYKDGTKEKIKDIPARIKLDPKKQYTLKV
jgi:FKBP-type peptidyl-prolyl cis-trans isomerase